MDDPWTRYLDGHNKVMIVEDMSAAADSPSFKE
jgi:hypothetical protein